MLDENFNRIIELIEQRKNKAYIKINEELILMYLDVGNFLYDLQQDSKYGDEITTKADYIYSKQAKLACLYAVNLCNFRY